MSIPHKENNQEKIIVLGEIYILKAAMSLNLLNHAINRRNDSLFRILVSVDRFQHDD